MQIFIIFDSIWERREMRMIGGHVSSGEMIG